MTQHHTINDAIRIAWATGRIEVICRVVDALRFQCGFTYDDTLARFQRVVPNLTPARFDEVLYARDEGYSGTLHELRYGGFERSTP